jgi:transcriptional regulator MraZ
VFRGRYEHTIDLKGRLSIPSRYREDLMARGVTMLVLSEGDHCVWAFPLDAWEQLEERLRQHPQLSPERRNVVRVMVASAKECPVDRAGRTLVPPELREFAGLKREVVMTRKLSEHGI